MNNGKPIIQTTIVFISILQENIHSLPPQSIQMSFVEVKIRSIHTGLRTLPSSVSRRRRSREGPTALMLLKSSLMPVGRGPRAWGTGPSCSRKKETEDMTSWDRESRYGMCVGGREGRQGPDSRWVWRRVFKQAELTWRERTCLCRNELPSPITKGRKQMTGKGLGLGAGSGVVKRRMKRDCDSWTGRLRGS